MSWILIIFWFRSFSGQIEVIQNLDKEKCERLAANIKPPTSGAFEVQCVNKNQ